MKKKNIEEEMEKRFDEYFAEYYVIKSGLTEDHKKTIKSFIQSEIDSARQQERERIIEIIRKRLLPDCWDENTLHNKVFSEIDQTLQDIIKKP